MHSCTLNLLTSSSKAELLFKMATIDKDLKRNWKSLFHQNENSVANKREKKNLINLSKHTNLAAEVQKHP